MTAKTKLNRAERRIVVALLAADGQTTHKIARLAQVPGGKAFSFLYQLSADKLVTKTPDANACKSNSLTEEGRAWARKVLGIVEENR